MLLSSIYLKENQIPLMKEQLESIIQNVPNNQTAFIQLGLAHLYQGNIENAVQAFLNAGQNLSNPYQGQIDQALAWLSYMQNDLEASLDFSEKAIRRLTDKVYPAIVKANILMLNDQTDEAVSEISKSTSILPMDKDYYLKFADHLKDLPQNQSKILVATNNAITFASFQWYDLATSKYREALALAPEQPFLKKMLATILALTDKTDEALSLYKDLLSSGETPQLHQNIGNIYMTNALPAQAILHFEKAIELAPDNASAWMQLGMVYETQNDPKNALASYEEVIELAPKNSAALNNAAWLLATDNIDLDKALEHALAAESFSKTEGSIKDTLGWVYYLKGEMRRAENKMIEAIELMPDHPSLHYHLGVILHHKGDLKTARQELNTALGMGTDFADYDKALELIKRIDQAL